MTGQNDKQDESLTGEGRTLSIDRPLFWALYLNINPDKCVER